MRLLRDERATVITTNEETEAIRIMSDNEGTAAQGPREDEQRLEDEIQKEINKLKYFLEKTDDLIQIKDYTEMEIVTKRAENIADRLSDLISHTEEFKIDSGVPCLLDQSGNGKRMSKQVTRLLLQTKKGCRKP